MSVPTPIVHPSPPAFEVKRAKKGKWCSRCNLRIEAGDRYALLDQWTWAHICCLQVQS